MQLTAMTNALTSPNTLTSLSLFHLPSSIFYMIVVAMFLGMVCLLFTTYRNVVGYFFAGMSYWLVVEALAWLIRTLFLSENLHEYVLAVGLTFVPIILLLNWVETRQTTAKTLSSSIKQPVSSFVRLFKEKTTYTPPRSTILVAGQRPVRIEQDTDFSQHFIRHSPVFDYE